MKTGRGFWFGVFLLSVVGVLLGIQAVVKKVWFGVITSYGSDGMVIGMIVVCVFLATAAMALRNMMRPPQ